MSYNFDRPHTSPPIYPAGVNGIEARVKALEVHLWHNNIADQERDQDIAEAHRRVSDLEKNLQGLIHRVGLYIIAALFAACGSLMIAVLKIYMPNIFTN